ncbi:MAG: xseA [Clostridiales bacterium]|jgi:exodeoxyribonuclease VII large subunit|nr:xseA [Clostridiales bacterium]
MPNIYSVGQVNQYIKDLFTRDYLLSDIQIRGEVSNCKYHTSGHIYFTLKDPTSSIACVMFSSDREHLNFKLTEGQSIVVRGGISVYPRDGKYQLYAKSIVQDGVGALYQQFEELKAKLNAKGYFDQDRKKNIPTFAKKIGIVTAQTGAAIQDIINISKRRNPFIQLILYPAQVQGMGAAKTIVRGINVLDKMDVDVIIIGRGGGSIEDLWCFNEEIVADAIFNAKTPIISAVGHEVDFTISDFVSDLRAPTPSAAAEIAVFDYNSLNSSLQQLKYKLDNTMRHRIVYYNSLIKSLSLRLNYQKPDNKINQQKQRVADLADRLVFLLEQKVKDKRTKLELLHRRLESYNPANKLEKGFAYVTNEANLPVIDILKVNNGEMLKLILANGELEVEVKNIKIKKEEVK